MIPRLLGGERDIVGQAATGTGKTAAFGLPILEKIAGGSGHVQALVLAPTRELAIQVAEELESLKGAQRLNVLPIYGGQAFGPQFRGLRQGADIVVGTPGRVLDHIERGSLDLSQISFLVLDEADEMLNMGFIEDIEAVMAAASPERRTLLFSATMPQDILRIAKRYMGDFEHVSVAREKSEEPLTEQVFHEVAESDRFEALCRVIDASENFYGLVFCRTRADVDHVAVRLQERGYAAEGLHGDASQAQREKVLGSFRRKLVTVLVATDVAARGIDVQELTHVVNFALPQDPETYVHRIGRTGRAGCTGRAVTIITPNEFRKLTYIVRNASGRIEKEKLPCVEEVITARKTRLREGLNAALEQGGLEPFEAFARELMAENSPEEALAAVLKMAYRDDLDPSRYRTIDDAPQRGFSAGNGRTEMFFAAGRADGVSPRDLVDRVARESHINPRLIQGVKILARHSIFTVPDSEAELIERTFRKLSAGAPPLVRRSRQNGGSKPRNFSSRGGFGNRRGEGASRPEGGRRYSDRGESRGRSYEQRG
ncbi:ATP-dependent RNA helicase DeaD [Desulfobaculum xiamenense]|uniref:RNA helicase n=1 Tax=Desulfobaculum xiamenense TaxID=995050 RepID=A0A846QGL0_9BACT|nr:ATP-dependent RNA helicase DeaD [Desulfobaculum xiamenense]